MLLLCYFPFLFVKCFFTFKEVFHGRLSLDFARDQFGFLSNKLWKTSGYLWACEKTFISSRQADFIWQIHMLWKFLCESSKSLVEANTGELILRFSLKFLHLNLFIFQEALRAVIFINCSRDVLIQRPLEKMGKYYYFPGWKMGPITGRPNGLGSFGCYKYVQVQILHVYKNHKHGPVPGGFVWRYRLCPY